MRARKQKLVRKPPIARTQNRKPGHGSGALLGLGLLFLAASAAAFLHPMAYGSIVRMGRRHSPVMVASEGNAMVVFALLFLFVSFFCLLIAWRIRKTS